MLFNKSGVSPDNVLSRVKSGLKIKSKKLAVKSVVGVTVI